MSAVSLSAASLSAASLSAGLALGMLICFGVLGCQGNDQKRTLPSIQLAMDPSVGTFYNDGEMKLYEVRIGTQLPILAPSAAEQAKLDAEPMDPYGHTPWIELSDVRVQLSFTLTNLEDTKHDVEVLIDPWNEFAKYSPGLQLVDAQRGTYLPNLSGIDYLYELDPVSAGEGSRRHVTYTFDDMDEMARDFATAMNLKANPPMPLANEDPNQDPTVAYVNHAFSFQNQSSHDLLVKPWIPPVIPGLVGFDVGLRTSESTSTTPADDTMMPGAPKIAIEVVAEVVDTGSHKVQVGSNKGTLLAEPTTIFTVGTAPP